MFSNNANYNNPFAHKTVTVENMSICYKYAMLRKQAHNCRPNTTKPPIPLPHPHCL